MEKAKPYFCHSLIGLIILGYSGIVLAAPSITGSWTTVDDATKKKRSVVNISSSGGTYSASIVKFFKQPNDADVCRKCTGKLKNKPIVGLPIMWGVRKTGEYTYGGGRILDPKNGKTYNVTLTVSPNGKSLKVRGYIGIPMFGRTQNWHR